MTLRRLTRVTPLAAFVAAGCFATRNDVRLLQADIAKMAATQASAEDARKADAERSRADAARKDTAQREMSRQLAGLLHTVSDSVLVLSEFVSKFRANQQLTDHDFAEQLASLQVTLGISQKQMAALRASLQARDEDRGPTGGGGSRPDSAASTGVPGPTRLYQAAMDQLTNNATGSARDMFQDLITNYPSDSLVPKALFQIANTYARENQDATADSVYAQVVDRYPKSEVAPTALYKRAVALAKAGQANAARALYERIIKDYPGSDEVLGATENKAKLPPP